MFECIESSAGRQQWKLGRFIPDEFLIFMTAFMDRGSVTNKNPAKIFRGRAAGKSVKTASFS